MTHDRISRPLLALPIAALILTLSACGSARPAVDDVATGLHKIFGAEEHTAENMDLYTKKAAHCLAEHLVDSDLSDATLAAIADGRDEPANVADRDLTVTIIKDHSPECLGE